MYDNKNFEEYHEYDELEKIYKKRKLKKYLYRGIIAIIIIGGGYFVLNSYSKEDSVNTSPTTKKSEQKQFQQKVTELKTSTSETPNLTTNNSSSEQKKEKKENKLTLNPIIPEVNNIVPENRKEQKLKKTEEVENKTEIKKENKEVVKKSENEEKPKIVIKVQTDNHSLNELIDDYNSFPSYDTAIKISKIYFNNGRYKDAIEWAKRANNIDSKKEDSWLIYAKSLVNLGNVKTAKKLLNAYINIYGNNKKIEEYLRTLHE